MLRVQRRTSKRSRTNLDISDSVKLLHPLPPTCVTFSSCGTYLAVAGKRISIFSSASIGKAATPIASFQPPSSSNMVTAMSFSPSYGLCVAHRDGAFLYTNALDSNCSEHTLLDGSGFKSQCTFNANGTLVAISVDSIVYIVDVQTLRSVVQLEGHGAVVTCLGFNPHHPTQLATASEDRSFKLWDIQRRCLLYQSSIISSSPFTSLAFDPYRERLVVGSEDGKIRFYMLSVTIDGSNQSATSEQHHRHQQQQNLDQEANIKVHVREEQTVDIGILLKKRNNVIAQQRQDISDAEIAYALHLDSNPDAAPHVVSSLPNWAREITNTENNREDDGSEGLGGCDVEIDTTALALHFRKDFKREEKNKNKSRNKEKAEKERKRNGMGWHGSGVLNGIDEEEDKASSVQFWKNSTTWLIVGTPNALVHVDTSSYEVDTVLNFRDAHVQPQQEQQEQQQPSSWKNNRRSCTTSSGVTTSAMPPPAPSSPTALLPNQNQVGGCSSNVGSGGLRAVLSPLSAQAMSMETAKQKQAVPLDMTASCFAFAYFKDTTSDGGEESSVQNGKRNSPDRRANRMEYYKNRLAVGGGGSGKNSEKNSNLKTTPSTFLNGLLCVVGSAFVPGATVLKLPREPIDSTVATSQVRVNERNKTNNHNGTNTDTNATFPSSDNINSATTNSTDATVIIAAPALPTPLSLFPTAPLSSDSPLRNFEFKTPTKARKGRNSSIRNKPVTFHRNIRSSGYGKKAPIMTLHGKKKKRPSKYRTSTTSATTNHTAEEYPIDCNAPKNHQRSHQYAMDGQNLKGSLHNGPITGIQYTRDANYVATCSADRTATSMRLPCSKYTEEKHRSVHLGHDGPVHSIDWSHNSQSQLLLTASTDGSAKLWQRGRADAVLTFDHWFRSVSRSEESKSMKLSGIGNAHRLTSRLGSSSSASSITTKKKSFSNHHTNKKNPPYGNASVTQAGFVYMDHFILLSVGNSLCLHKYSVGTMNESMDDLRRLQNHSKYKMVTKYEQSSQSITSFTNANSFYSTLVITTGSNRSVTLYDLGKGGNGAISTTIPDAHSRSVLKCSLPSFSDYTNHPNAAYDIFMTIGAEGAVKLWDIRSPIRPVRTFSCHSRSTALSMDPTMRFISCVSKDSSNVLSTYDIRNGGLIENIQCGTEGICSVEYSPRHPQLCVGSADGRLRFFTA